MHIPHDQQFHFRDGAAVSDLEGLRAKLEGISYQEFYRHANADKNDFANWVQHVLNEDQLAEELRKVTSIVETVEIINDHISPLPVDSPHDDIQSKIEETLEIHPPSDTSEHHEMHDHEEHDEHDHEGEEDFPLIKDDIEKHEKTEHSQPQMPQHDAHRDHVRMIVKDFMYGVVFGLIIGLILGRILSF